MVGWRNLLPFVKCFCFLHHISEAYRSPNQWRFWVKFWTKHQSSSPFCGVVVSGWEVWGTPEAWSHSEINLHWAQGFAHAHWLALGFMWSLADVPNKKNRSQRAIYSCCSLRFPSLPSALLLLTIWHSYTLMFSLPSTLASTSPSLFYTDFIHQFTWEAIRSKPNQANERNSWSKKKFPHAVPKQICLTVFCPLKESCIGPHWLSL